MLVDSLVQAMWKINLDHCQIPEEEPKTFENVYLSIILGIVLLISLASLIVLYNYCCKKRTISAKDLTREGKPKILNYHMKNNSINYEAQINQDII